MFITFSTLSSAKPRSVGDGATDFMRFMPTVPGEGGEKLRRLRWFLPPRRGSFPQITSGLIFPISTARRSFFMKKVFVCLLSAVIMVLFTCNTAATEVYHRGIL